MPGTASEAPISSELYQAILSGQGTREQKLAASDPTTPLTPVQRIEVLATLAEDPDMKVREQAVSTLLAQPTPAIVAALQAEAPPAALFRFCGGLTARGELAFALAMHPRCPLYILPVACEHMPVSGLQELFDNLDLLSSRPYLTSALLRSPILTAEQREQLRELLEETDKKIVAQIEDIPGEDPVEREKRVTLLQRLSKMRVVERVQLALKGNREERMALIRDPCKVVQRAVLQSPRLTEREVEGFSSMATLSEDVLRLISRNRVFISNPTVVRNLLNNPKTPLDISLHFLPNANAQELKALTLNRNIPETLRTQAIRLQRQRSMQRA
jgi:hypothetical protein